MKRSGCLRKATTSSSSALASGQPLTSANVFTCFSGSEFCAVGEQAQVARIQALNVVACQCMATMATPSLQGLAGDASGTILDAVMHIVSAITSCAGTTRPTLLYSLGAYADAEVKPPPGTPAAAAPWLWNTRLTGYQPQCISRSIEVYNPHRPLMPLRRGWLKWKCSLHGKRHRCDCNVVMAASSGAGSGQGSKLALGKGLR